MKTLVCPDCQEVMHQVEKITPRTTIAGIDQLARHCTVAHVLPSIERMLTYTAGLEMDIETLKANTIPACPACGKLSPEDSFLYVRAYGRTILCCSQHCVDLILQ